MSTSTAFGKQVADSAADECKKLPLHWEPISLTDDDEKQSSKSNETLVFTDRPIRKDLSTTCMRIAMIFVFLALISTLLLISLRFFVILEQRAEMEMSHRGELSNDEAQNAGSDYYYSVSDSEAASFELLFSTLMRALEEDSTRHRHPGCNRRNELTTGRHHRRAHGGDDAGNQESNSNKRDVLSVQGELTATRQEHKGNEELDSENAKSTQSDSLMTDLSQQGDDSTSVSESQDSKGHVWGFVHKSGIRIVNGRVVSNWDQMIQFGPSDESKPNAKVGTEPSLTAVALAQPSKTNAEETEVHPARGKHWDKSFIGGHLDSTSTPKPGRKHGRWPMKNMRDWMSERFGKFRNLFSSMAD